MIGNNLKEVNFEYYCERCKYANLYGMLDPCNTCLDNPFNMNSEKPTEYVERDGE